MKLEQIRADLRVFATTENSTNLMRFFKTGAGQYGEGDRFIGVTVPNIRRVAKKFRDLPDDQILELLHSPWHEERMCALLVWDCQFAKSGAARQARIFREYLTNTKFVNNWDLVDLSCRDIVGRYIFEHSDERATLGKLAASKLLWDRRIAMVSTNFFLIHGDSEPTIVIAKKLLGDDHDLIQKAVGWMLREMGKRVSRDQLIEFLRENYDQIPRTTLRYAIEHFDRPTRAKYLRGEI